MFKVISRLSHKYPDDPEARVFAVVDTATNKEVSWWGLHEAAVEKTRRLNNNIGSFNGCPVTYLAP